MLEHHANAELARRIGIGEPDLFAFPKHATGIGPLHTVDKLYQRGLTGAVFAQQRMYFAGHHLQADIVVRHHTRISLGDPKQFQSWCWCQGRFAHALVICCLISSNAIKIASGVAGAFSFGRNL